MPVELITIACLADNYAYVIHNPDTGETAVVDVPDAAPVSAALQLRGWRLTDIILTHHHNDHIDGVAELRAETGARVWGAAADAHRLPPLTHTLAAGDSFALCGQTVQVIDAPGHTVGHIAFYLADAGLAFTGDSLMSGGCGRLFEGTPDQMWATLTTLGALPPETLICSGHEYTLSNLRFAASLEPDSPALISRIARAEGLRHAGRPTLPVPLSEELATNPFLRAGSAAEFARRRAAKDKF